MNIDFSYYLSIFWRRLPYFLFFFALLSALGVTVAMLLPPQYEARATMVVESPQIPNELAASTVNTVETEQLQVIEQRLTTRASLIDTANRLGVFEDQENMTASQIVAAMRANTRFKASTGRNQATFFSVSFTSENPVMAARVANEFVTMILEENVRMRTRQAEGTLEFFADEVARLGAELSDQSAEILRFKTENANALPENRDVLISRQVRLSDQLRDMRQQIDTLEVQKERARELFEATGAVNGQQDALSPEQRALEMAKQELDEALLVFAPGNPKIRVLEARVQQLEQRLENSLLVPEEEAASPERSTASIVLDTQLADIDRQIADLRKNRGDVEEELSRLEAFISQIPANSMVLQDLERDYAVLQTEYQRAQARLSAAETGERIEILSKGQRITVLEQATTPTRPTKPNRPLIVAAGMGAGLMLGLGFVVLLELLNRSVRRPVEISDKLGITPFAVLPYIQTSVEARRRRLLIFGITLLFVLGVPLFMWLMHIYVRPLDGILESILNRFGLTLSLS